MIEYIHEPTDLQCGQAVLAMVLGKTVDEIVTMLQNDHSGTEKGAAASPLPAKSRNATLLALVAVRRRHILRSRARCYE